MALIDKETIRAKIERRIKFHSDALKTFPELNTVTLTHSAGLQEDKELLAFLDTLSNQYVEWSEEDKKMISSVVDDLERLKKNYTGLTGEYAYEAKINWLKSLRPQSQKNMSIGFMLYLDEHRPDGKMCLSNAECNEIETAFKNQSWDTILRYIEKYQPQWKPREEQMEALGEAMARLCGSGIDSIKYAELCDLEIELKKLM